MQKNVFVFTGKTIIDLLVRMWTNLFNNQRSFSWPKECLGGISKRDSNTCT